MASKELQTLNAVLRNKDIGILYGAAVDELFDHYRDVWQSVKEYHNKYHSIPDIEVMQEKFPTLESVEVKGNTEHYLDALRDEYVKSRMDNIMMKGAQALEVNGSAVVLAKLQESLAKLNRFTGAAQDVNIMDFDDAERHYEEVRIRAEANGGLPGIPTGISFIDSAYPSGFAPGDLVVMLGWTGRGKSLTAALFQCNAFKLGYLPMYASLEMKAEKVRDRVWTIMGSGLFSNSGLTLGQISTDSFKKFKAQNQDKPEFIVVTNDVGELTPNIVESKIDQHHPRTVVVDYAQLGSDNANSENMTARMMNMSKEYKRLAVKKGVTIILISSATAESASASDEPPMIEQVAWSRQLAYDADLAFAVHKHDESNLISIVCRKNRNGPLFAGMLNWDIDKGIITEEFE